jgi:hypothetical protein
MKITNFGLAIGLGLLTLVSPGVLRADTAYTYVGKAYNDCLGSYTCNGTTPFLSVTFVTSLNGAALDNLSGADITASVSNFYFNDNAGLSITNTDATDSDFTVTTDSSGNITAWSIFAESASSLGSAYFNALLTCSTVSLCSVEGTAIDFSDFNLAVSNGAIGTGGGGGLITNSPGAWGSPQNVPEPSSLILLASGLFGIVKMGRPRKRHA